MSVKTGKYFVALQFPEIWVLFAVHIRWRFEWFVRTPCKPEKTRFYTGPFELEISNFRKTNEY